ncbi:helix-hairpin-helix motif-domain-containing protein [Mycena vitilis]|nr:helix-hairpin-helix motif-domain-containing protein [Mycena vitilis]
MKEDKPSVLAVSWGKGDPHKDAITLVFLDSRGRMREQTKLDNLVDVEMRDEFIDLLRRRKSDVIGIEGFTMATTNCMLSDNASAETDQVYNTPVIYAPDDIAQLFQRSQRANEGFSTRSLITNTAYPKKFFRLACERAIIDVVNKVGVAVRDPYYQTLLSFICGLGPRKAQNLVKMIERQEENIGNREQFIKAGLLTKTLFINAAGFLRISPQEDLKPAKLRADDDHAPDPLDDTRIHPEDYESARKMAMDALEYDEEDIPENDKKLSELNLDEFAVSLYEAIDDHTLNVIRDELSHPFAEQSHPYQLSDGWDVLTMLSGETQRSLDVGLIITVIVLRAKPQFVNVKRESVSKESNEEMSSSDTRPKGVIISLSPGKRMTNYISTLDNVTEPNADPTGHCDEEELMASDCFKHGSGRLTQVPAVIKTDTMQIDVALKNSLEECRQKHLRFPLESEKARTL